MPAVRHILRTNTWEMQCPTCARMVPVDRAVFTGVAPFPEHSHVRASWSQRLFERYGMARALRDRAWFIVGGLIALEVRVRRFTQRWEPRCAYRETVAWNQEQWPASGIDSFGPTV